jgi:hypothetical protein
MSEPSTLLPVSLSASGYEDGLGRRSLEIDRESGVMLERLHLRPEIRAFEAFLRERVAFSAAVNDPRFAQVRSIERDGRGSLTVVSQFVAGNRLSDLLEAATGLPAHEATCPSVDAALGFLLEVLPALETLHDNGGYPHGTLGPGRIVLTPDSHAVMLDWIYGPIVERLQFSRRTLWLELGVAAPPAQGPPRVDVARDLAQASVSAMMIVLGRPLRRNEYPDGIAPLIAEVSEIAQIRGSAEFASGLEAYLHRTLPLATAQPHSSAAEAAAEVRQVAREIGVSRCSAALAAFVADMNRLLAEDRDEAPAEPETFSSEPEEESPLDELTAGFARVGDISLDDLSLTAHAALEESEASNQGVVPRLYEDAPPPSSAYPAPIPVYEDPPVLEDPPAVAIPEPIAAAPSLPPPAPIAPIAVSEAPKPIAVEAPVPVAEPVSRPEPIAKAEPISKLETELLPEPAITPEREPVGPSGFQFLDPGEPVVAKAPEPEPHPAKQAEAPPPAANVAASAPAAGKKESKRKRRGSKGQRDKLRSNAAPPPKPASAPAPPPPPPAPAAIPMPTFNRAPEPPRQDAPQIAVRPPAPPKAPAPLRLKTEGQGGFTPPAARVERRESPAVSPIPAFLDREEPAMPTQFPWRLAAAAAVAIVAVIGVGRWYIPGHDTPAAETTDSATTPAPAPAAAATKKVEATKPGSLAVTTQPAGAHVMLDGKDVGESPILLDNVAAGKHTLTFITASGTVKKSIRMESGKPLSIEVPIYSGWIAVFSPVTLDIAENGKPIGTTEQGRLMLSPGRHVLTFSNHEMGYKTTQSVDIEPGEERSVSLVPTGELGVNATPWAEVWLDGKKLGDTPLAGQRVPLGTHEVVFKNPQYPERRVTVTVTAAAPVTASVDFSKQ